MADTSVLEVAAAGAVLWRPSGDAAGVEIAVIHRPRYDDWSLPKGKLEPGETIFAAAAREVTEETGFIPVLGRFLTRVSYPTHKSNTPAMKTVHYLSARARSGRFQPNREVDTLRWLPPRAAMERLSYPHDLDVVRRFLALPADLTTVLLVRHAEAGERTEWSGPDDLRPLTEAGWRHVKHLRDLASLFGVDRIHTAPPLRCIQTMRPLAEDLGQRMVEEPPLSERGYRADPAAGTDRLRQIAAAGGTPAVCSQGGVIPDLLSRMAEGTDVELHEPRARKGSAWLLSFHRDAALADAFYIPER